MSEYEACISFFVANVYDSDRVNCKSIGLKICLHWSDSMCRSNMATDGVSESMPTTDFDAWWNSTEIDHDPLGGRPYPSLYSWTHIGLSAFVVTAITRQLDRSSSRFRQCQIRQVAVTIEVRDWTTSPSQWSAKTECMDYWRLSWNQMLINSSYGQ